jgi:hypothetical protein
MLVSSVSRSRVIALDPMFVQHGPAGDDVTLLVAGDLIGEPARMWFAPDHDEQRPGRDSSMTPLLPSRSVMDSSDPLPAPSMTSVPWRMKTFAVDSIAVTSTRL